MDATLHDLGNLLVQAVPTVLFFIFLSFYLKRVLFRPIARILDERKRATEGVRELAQRAFEAAEKKTSEFERALQIARAEIHQEQEILRRQWAGEQVEEIARARTEADRQIEEAKRKIAQEVERAQGELDASAGSLSEQIVSSVLRRKAA